MKHPFKFRLIYILIFSVLVSCGSSQIATLPMETLVTVPQKVSELSENELKSWGHLNPVKDTVPGMSINLAYDEIIKNKRNTGAIRYKGVIQWQL